MGFRLYKMPNSNMNGFRIRLSESGRTLKTKEQPLVMAEDFQHKHVGTVAGIIGLVIFLLGMLGIVFSAFLSIY